ncbi:MocR-like pyridoxine biosynthesis transcription factor PdxR [Oceanibium sediminis]|uniref:MocR-like pyridoxine biosynthesis transcription factor PdxR n=1 Tax=Oceanibium sediminis TaxID=2026339 RepID=UPI000DD4B5FB|nr:PLP-dependent aminotransferase family protein [Oceanibium sediminis]
MRISESQFFVDRDSGISLQAQLRERIAAAILARRFMPGQKLPSSRGLANHLGIARITVSLVYQDLVADGYLESAARSGFFVAEDPPGLMTAPARVPEAQKPDVVGWEQRLGRRYQTMRGLAKPLDWRAYPYPFIYGQLDPELFPHDDWRDCARRGLGKREFDQVSGDSFNADDPKLVDYILSHSLPSRGVLSQPDEVLVTLGAQNALWTVIELLSKATPGLRVAMEEPGYSYLREVLRLTGCDMVPIPVDEKGLDPDALPEGLDLVCVTPSHQAPTCATMPMERRRRLLQLASERNFLVLEDDYDFEMSFLKPASPALKAEDTEGRVIHIGSFSKPLFPGLRLGYLAAPAPFIAEARGLRILVMRHPPGGPQRTTAHFLAQGHYNAHVNRLRNAFRKRRSIMLKAFEDEGITGVGGSDHGGAGFWIEGPKGLNTEQLAEDLRADGVLIEHGSVFYAAENPPQNFYRMAYSSIPERAIPEGVARVARRLRAMGFG